MSLENAIKELTKAIERNNQLLNLAYGNNQKENIAITQNIEFPKNEEILYVTEQKEEAQSEEVQEENKPEPEVTVESVKELAKVKIANGAKRTDVKAMITKLGADQISELKHENLIELHNQLSKLK